MFETSAKQFRAFRDINGLKGLASGLLGKTPLDPLDKSLIALCYDLIEVGVFLYLVCFVRLFFCVCFHQWLFLKGNWGNTQGNWSKGKPYGWCSCLLRGRRWSTWEPCVLPPLIEFLCVCWLDFHPPYKREYTTGLIWLFQVVIVPYTMDALSLGSKLSPIFYFTHRPNITDDYFFSFQYLLPPEDSWQNVSNFPPLSWQSNKTAILLCSFFQILFGSGLCFMRATIPISLSAAGEYQFVDIYFIWIPPGNSKNYCFFPDQTYAKEEPVVGDCGSAREEIIDISTTILSFVEFIHDWVQDKNNKFVFLLSSTSLLSKCVRPHFALRTLREKNGRDFRFKRVFNGHRKW